MSKYCVRKKENFIAVCGFHPSALIMDLKRKIAFEILTEEFEEITIDRNNIEPDFVDTDSSWEKNKLAVISNAFIRSSL